MKQTYDLHDVWALLFVFSIENTHSVAREETITSKNINCDEDLKELFDLLICPEFMHHKSKEQALLIDTLEHFLKGGDSFGRVFLNMDTYFDDNVHDQRRFMHILLTSLIKYKAEG